nr:Hpt domain-containing protein [Sphingopyxis sp. BSNA05]
MDRLTVGMATIGDWPQAQSDDIAIMLHKLAGSAGSFGEKEMASVAKQLEDAIKQEKPVEVLMSIAEDLLAYRYQHNEPRARQA